WSLDLVAAVTETEPDGWQAAHDELVEARLVRVGEHGYLFAHDIIRDAVERETDATTQRSLHLRAGMALAALAEREPETLPERAEELARHFVLAGPRGIGRAYFWTQEAARRSLQTFAHERAAEQLQLAIDYAEGGLVSDPAELAALYLDLAEALARGGRMREARNAGDRALDGFAAAGDCDAVTTAAARLAGLFDANRFPDLVIEYTGKALSLPEIERSPAYPLLVQQRAYAQERRGDAAALAAAAETLAELARRNGDRRSALEGQRCTALFLSNYSLDLERCAALRLELREAYAALGEPFLAIELLADAADALLRIGELRRARPHAEASVAEARRLQGAAAAFATCPVLLEIYLTTGEFAALDALFAELAPYLVDAPTGRAIQFFGAKGVADMWRGLPRMDVTEVGMHGDDLVWREMRIVGQIWAAMQAGDFGTARALLDQMAPLVPPLGQGMRWFVAALPLVYNYNEIGCGKEAAVWCEGLLRHPTFQIPGGQGRLEAARTLRLNGDPGTAGRLLDEAVAHFEREGMRPFLAQARLEQGRLALAGGDEALAQRRFEQAAAGFAALGMVPYLARARALQRAGSAAAL
ncbi:MAG TPA: hypothetical protein VFD32_18520, partial [Dehalococcoidia bacterium]|nr:hypothetical protein [Dehalococcoidia bacterium]